VSRNVNIEDFFLISQLSKYFSRSLEVFRSLIIPNDSNQIFFGDFVPQTCQLYGNGRIEDFLRISKLSKYFSKPLLVSQILIIPNKSEQFFFWWFWTQHEPVVSRNVNIEDFFLIIQLSKYFSSLPKSYNPKWIKTIFFFETLNSKRASLIK
jgi:hypothetical protein